jgi:hypothetical protein
MIYFETGLHHHLTDAKVTSASRISWLVYKFIEESFPESFESLNLLFKDQSQEEWSSLRLNVLIAPFILLGYCFTINLLFLYLEILYSFLLKYLCPETS